MTQAAFRRQWQRNAVLGLHDGADSLAYLRVHAQWISRGRPQLSGDEIARLANFPRLDVWDVLYPEWRFTAYLQHEAGRS